MEQRIARAKARVADADAVQCRAPWSAPSGYLRYAMIYLIFNEGYSASGDTAEIRAPCAREAIGWRVLRLFRRTKSWG